MANPTHQGNVVSITLAGKSAYQERKEFRKKFAAAIVLLLAGGLAADLERGHAPADLAITPTQLAFNPQPVNTTSEARYVQLANPGSSPVPIGMLALSRQSGFVWDVGDCTGGNVPASGSCNVRVTFRPAEAGSATADLVRTATGQRVALSGTGVGTPLPPPAARQSASVQPPSHSFGLVVIGADAESRFMVHNTGSVALSAVRLRLEGEHGADFHLATSMCGDPRELPVNQSCEGMVRFVPEEAGEHSATLAVYAGPARLGSAQLTGAARPKPLPHIEISPNPMDFDKVKDAYVVIRNTGTGKLTLNGFSLDDKSRSFTLEPLECQNASPLDAGESCRVHVIFMGKRTAVATVTVNHNDMNGTKTIVLFANVPNNTRNKILTALLAAGLIARLIMVASQGSGAAPPGNPRAPAPANTGSAYKAPQTVIQ